MPLAGLVPCCCRLVALAPALPRHRSPRPLPGRPAACLQWVFYIFGTAAVLWLPPWALLRIDGGRGGGGKGFNLLSVFSSEEGRGGASPASRMPPSTSADSLGEAARLQPPLPQPSDAGGRCAAGMLPVPRCTCLVVEAMRLPAPAQLTTPNKAPPTHLCSRPAAVLPRPSCSLQRHCSATQRLSGPMEWQRGSRQRRAAAARAAPGCGR